MDTINVLRLARSIGWTYNPQTGEVISHKGKVINGRKVQNNQTYIICGVKVNGVSKTFYAHQFAYYYMTGELPTMVDHITHDQNDPIYNNRFINLRPSDRVKNAWNRPYAKGYSYDKNLSKYRSYIRYGGKYIRLGNFDNELDARKAYLDAKKKYHIQ